MDLIKLPDLSHIIDNLAEGILFLDKDRRILSINRSALDMIGQTEDKAGTIISQLCPDLFPGAQCARECELSGVCSLMAKNHKEMEKAEDVTLGGPENTMVTLNLRAIAIASEETQARCAILLTNRTQERQLAEEVSQRIRMGGLIGRSVPMRKLFQHILRAATSDASVLIEGESGTGKELVARSLHENSNRSNGPYVRVHCAALAENLLESELFGHGRGAYTGATTERKGRFEAAHTGTLLLDEIGEISPAIQVKLLRVLQEREVERLGENTPRKVDVRIIAATNRNLLEMVRAGTFREDLYYRLHVLPIQTPTLRSRRDDIPLLVQHLLSEMASRYGRTLEISPEALQVLENYDWPGNIRELVNILEFAFVQSDGLNILPSHFPPEIHNQIALPAYQTAETKASGSMPISYYRSRMQPDEEKELILHSLKETGGNKAAAARKLGMSRTTLWKRLKHFGMV
ncbi:MAG: sigma 54-interacting transcriptional regulator [Mariprofundaceae bacterium]|nr:sigma 54-interacting transcriptional regulator [Mariprofundaceae bacterium]